ncbi:MAG TPA: AraC family transcriptional regulator [Capsulimonadaceae bacterium]|jgi:AraC-like DNA-binding protein
MKPICRFFKPIPLHTKNISVRGIGIMEEMPPALIDRPIGSGDYLVMMFISPVTIKVDGIPTNVDPDSVMIWEPGREQVYGYPDGKWTHSWIHCSGKRVDATVISSGTPQNRPFRLKNRSVFDHYLSEIYSELTSHATPSEEIVVNALHSLLVDMARQVAGDKAAVPDELLAVRNFIGENISDSHTLATLAQRVSLSPSHFSSLFKSHFGQPPIDYLIELRLHTASNLLGDGNRSVAEVATAVGYEDPFHFSKQFKARFGVSPRDVRKGLR